MIKNRRSKIYQYSPFLISIATLLVIIITGICLLIFLPKSDKVEYEIIYDGIKSKGLIIRNERFTDLSGYEKLYFNNIVEGQSVNEQTKIVSAYKKGYIKNTFEKLTETEKNIVSYLNQNIIKGFDDKVIQQYDFEIDVVIGNMSSMQGGFIELYASLSALMKERVQYIRNNYNADQYLEKLYNDEQALMASLEPWCDNISVDTSGFVGFYCDGIENVFNNGNVLDMTFSDFSGILKKDISDNLNGFKLVADDKWYLLVDVDEPDKFTPGNYYQVYISNEAQSEIGYLEKIIDEKKGNALVFSFSDNVEKYLDLRVTDIFIGSRYEGYCVKNKFIKNSTTIIKIDKKKTQIPVEILYQDNKKTVFKYDEQISLGQKVYNK